MLSSTKIHNDYLTVFFKRSSYLLTASNYIEIDGKKILVVEFLCASNCVKFWLVNTIFPLPIKSTLQEKRELLRKIPLAVNEFTNDADHILIIGGFNLPFYPNNYSPLRLSGYDSAIAPFESTMQMTCQNYDNIWYKQTDGLKMNKAQVLRFDDNVCDHCPLMVEMYVKFLTTTSHDSILQAMEQLQTSKQNYYAVSHQKADNTRKFQKSTVSKLPQLKNNRGKQPIRMRTKY